MYWRLGFPGVPSVGGRTSTTALTLGMIPALDALVKQWQLGRNPRNAPAAPADAAHSTAEAT